MSDEILTHRKRAQALMHYILSESELTAYRTHDYIRSKISPKVIKLCKEKGIERFSFDSPAKIELLSIEQCQILDEACLQTYGHLWLEFNEKLAAA